MFNAIKKFTATFLTIILFVVAAITSIHTAAQTNPSVYTTAKRYNMVRQLTGVISPDPDGAGPRGFPAVRNTYNAQGMLVLVESGYLSVWQDHNIKPKDWSGFNIETKRVFTYDDWGRKLTGSAQDSLGNIYRLKHYSYDSLGRLECENIRMNPSTYLSLPASACTVTTAGIYGQDRITKYTYDTKNRITKIQKAYGTSLQQDYATYTYNGYWEKENITDANGNMAQHRYDGFGRLKRWVFPSKTQTGSLNEGDYEEYGYDANDNRTSFRKRDGQIITYTPDNLNRIKSKDLPGTEGDVAYEYDNRNLEKSAKFTATGKGITTGYDAFGRITSSTNSMFTAARTLNYEYDDNGNRTKITHPDGIIKFGYAYDGLNLLTNVCENNDSQLPSTSNGMLALRCADTTKEIVSPTYNNTSQRTGTNLAGGGVSSYGYDDIDRLASLTHNLSGTTSDITIGLPSYNPANQILTRTISNNTYLYTGNQNIVGSYAVNGLNQYTSAGGKIFEYDNNSNLTKDGSGTTFVYDTENRLTSASGTKSATLKYDPKGRLFEITSGGVTTQFLYDGDALVAEYVNGTITNRYVHGSRVDEPYVWYTGSTVSATTRRNLHSDHQGSIIAVSNSSAVMQRVNTYDVYGIPGSNNLGRFSYTGQIYLPEVGLHYYKARIYSSQLGRFLQTDPIGYDDNMNLYAYTGNDPFNKIDTSGLCEKQLLAKDTGCKLKEAVKVEFKVTITGKTTSGLSATASVNSQGKTFVGATGATKNGVSGTITRNESGDVTSSVSVNSDGTTVTADSNSAVSATNEVVETVKAALTSPVSVDNGNIVIGKTVGVVQTTVTIDPTVVVESSRVGQTVSGRGAQLERQIECASGGTCD